MSQIACPSCGAEMSLDVALTHEELRRAVHDVLTMSLPLGTLVMRYVALFKPPKNRLSPSRMAKLVTELLPDLQRGAIEHKGRLWSMPIEGWKAGLEAMLDKAATGKLDLPLGNHNYLYSVLVGLADRAEAREERQAEQAAGARTYTSGAKPLQDAVQDMDNAIARAAQAVVRLAEGKPGTSPHVRKLREQLAAIKNPPKEKP